MTQMATAPVEMDLAEAEKTNPEVEITYQFPYDASSNDALSMEISEADRSNATVRKSRKMLWGQFAARLCTHLEGPKDGACFVPAMLRGTRRFAEEVVNHCALCFDLDSGANLEDLRPKLTDLEAVIYSSFSHERVKDDIVCPRWRVVLPFRSSFACTPDQWKSFYLRVAEHLQFDVDTQCADSGRLFFYGRHESGYPFHSEILHGSLFDPTAVELLLP